MTAGRPNGRPLYPHAAQSAPQWMRLIIHPPSQVCVDIVCGLELPISYTSTGPQLTRSNFLIWLV